MRPIFTASILAGMLTLVTVPGHALDAERLDWRVFAHVTAQDIDKLDDGVEYDVPLVRPRIEYKTNQGVSAVLQLDVAVDGFSRQRVGTLPNGVLDLYVQLPVRDRHRLRIGQFKTPLGMDFSVPGDGLSITQRGLETGLVLNRAAGVMFSGETAIPGVGYDVGAFAAPGRSGAVRMQSNQEDNEVAITARLRYDRGALHMEGSWGSVDAAGGPGTDRYRVYDLAARYRVNDWQFAFEWIEGDGVRGEGDRTERGYYVGAEYRVRSNLDLVVRYYEGRSHREGTSVLANTYAGVSYQLPPMGPMTSRMQFNYLLADKDTRSYTGVRGFRGDGWFAQLQLRAAR